MTEPNLIVTDVTDPVEWTSAYVSVEFAASLIGTASVIVERLMRQGELDWVLRPDGTYLSLPSVLDYARLDRARRRAGLEEMIRVSEEGGLYELERDLLREAQGD